MTDWYLRSTTGNNANSGADWANAKATLAGFVVSVAAGDTIYVSQAHAETTAASQSAAYTTTAGTPIRILCVNDGATPPVALALTGALTVTGASTAWTLTGSLYFYGLTFTSATSGNAAINMGGSWSISENCKFRTGVGSTGGRIFPIGSGGTNGVCDWINCTVKFVNAAQNILVQNDYFHWNGGGIEAGSTSPTALFVYSNSGAGNGGMKLLIENCDFTNGSSTMNMITGPLPACLSAVFRNCLLPSSWTGTWVTAFATNQMGRVEIYNCHDTASYVSYKLKIIDGCGNIDQETTIVRSAGASDGFTTISWKMVTGTQVGYPNAALYSPEILFQNGVAGSSITLTVDIVHDSVTALTDAEVWVEAIYPASSTAPFDTLTSDKTADVLTTTASQTTSTATWTTTGLSNPNKQKLEVTFTPQAIGPIKLRVALAKVSKTIYVDPMIRGAASYLSGQVMIPCGNTAMGQYGESQYFIKRYSFQYQLPGTAYLIGGDLPPTFAQFASRYFMVC